jgi:transposase
MKYVGIDWATEIHTVALVDEDGKLLAQWEVAHSRRGVDGLLQRLAREGGPEHLRITIESGAPLLVDQLLENGYREVFEMNPKQADRFRDRRSPSGCKDDWRDAWACADAGRTDVASLTRVVPDSDATGELLRRTRARERLVAHRVRVGLQLRDTIARFFPALLELGRDMHDGFFLALLEAYPTPVQARRATRPRLERLRREHRIRALDASAIQAVFKAPAFSVPEGIEAGCRDEAQDLAALIRLLNQQIQEAERRIDALFAHHPDRELVVAMPGIGEHTAAKILAELGDDPRRRTDPDVLTVYSGAAPVTRATGTRKKRRKNGQRASVHVSMRHGCNRRLQTAIWLAARNSVRKSRWARAFVAYRLERGDSHSAVIRALSLKWAKILAHVLQTRQPYDEERHIAHLLRNDVPWARDLAAPRDTTKDAA